VTSHRLAFVLLLATASAAAQQSGDSLLVDVGGRITVLHSLAGLPRDTLSMAIHDGPARRYSGVHLLALLQHAGFAGARLRGAALAQYFAVEASDGYRVSFGVGELDTALVDHALLLADSVDGGPLPANEGPWRLIVGGDRHSARSVRMVTAILVRDVAP